MQVEARFPYIRVTKQAESVMNRGGYRLSIINYAQEDYYENRPNYIYRIDVSKGESTGAIRQPCYSSKIVWSQSQRAGIKKAGYFVSVVNAMLIHNFSDNSLRKIKTDKADALKIANYGLTFLFELRPYFDEDEIRQMLKTESWLYVMKERPIRVSCWETGSSVF